MKLSAYNGIHIKANAFKQAIYLCVIILVTGCGGAGDSQAPDPVVLDLPIAYVKRPVPLDNNTLLPLQADASEALTFNEGGDLWIRDRANPSANARNLTLVHTEGIGDVKDVEASFDGSMFVFAMREPERATDLQTPTWNIWVYHIERDELKRLITDPIIAEAGEDVAPHFLPDDRIIFSSTRQIDSKVIRTDEGSINNTNKSAYTALDESRNEHALVLHTINIPCKADNFDNCTVNSSSDISQISFNQSHDIDTSVLMSGKMIFTRWDHAGGRNAMHLYKSNPDGTEMKLVYGRQSHNTGTPGSTVQFLQPREMADGRLLSILRPFTGTFGGGDIIAIDIENYTDNTRPVLPNQITSLTNGQESIVDNNVTTDTAPSPGGRYSAAYPLWDGTDRLLVSWTPCRLLETTTIVTCTPARLADPAVQEAQPLYGLYIFDPADKTQRPIFQPEEDILYTDIVVAQDRTRPTPITNKVPGVDPDMNLDLANRSSGLLHIRSVYDVDGVFRSLGINPTSLSTLNNLATNDPDGYAGLYNFSRDNRLVAYLADPSRFSSDERPARFLRIIKSVGIPDELNGADFDIDNDAFGISAQQGMREIIGYAPIEPDGSVMVEVPANVPLAISVVDKNGRRITPRHLSWIQVKPGETVTCSGCHNPTPNAVNPVDGIHGHATEPEGANPGAPQNGYIFPGTMTNPLIIGDTIASQTTGQTMAQARYGEQCDKAPADCRPNFDIDFFDTWTDGTEAAFSYEFRQLPGDEIIPLSSNCYDATTSLNKWEAACRNVINYPETIQPVWDSARAEDIVCDPALQINDPRCDIYINPPTPPAVPYVFPLTVNVDSTCTSCHTAANQRLDLTNTANGNFFLSYTDLFGGRTVQQQTRDASCNLQTISIPDPNDPTGMTFITVPDIQPFAIPAQMSVNGAVQSVFFDRFDADIMCQTVDHKAMLSVHEKKFLSEWLDIGAQYYNDPTNANVPVN
jgi:hypothetical protein